MVLYILKADTLHPDILAVQGDYSEVYTSRLRAAGYTTETQSIDVEVGEYPKQLGPDDAIMISGSKKNAWEDIDWILKLTEYVKSHIGKVPIFGVCFGHQIVARALGAKVGPSDRGWEASGLPVKPTSLAQELFPSLGDAPVFMHMHKDQVHEVPNGTELLFSTSITPVQGFYKKGEILTVQFHPEFDEQIVSIICKNRFEGEFLESTLERAAGPNEGLEFMKYASKFLNKEL